MRIVASILFCLLAVGAVAGAPLAAESGFLGLILGDSLGPLIAPIVGLECAVQVVSSIINECKFHPADVGRVFLQVITHPVFSEAAITKVEAQLNPIILGFTNELCSDPTCYNTLHTEYLAVYDQCSSLVEQIVPSVLGIEEAVFKTLLPTLLQPEHDPFCLKDPSTGNFCGIEVLENFEKVMLPSFWEGGFDPSKLSLCTSCFDAAVFSLANETLTQSFADKCPSTAAIQA
ncbi:uncharacterized protein BJ171DRAFT_126515 [Polychytrium aggregatum]|uniref:uncharacterized protein n=1 Tax=Polychytrium aggregatum TaxID=110093 RepID=UPI0022FE01CD|nr:uncharacterized protein BJ171DRAFT_126515 [Polychytrium aggregatum]KAI9203962.1 hypothetical protein BJ171DRAFT_126515 [Polychytrium aggregatum]